MARPQVTASGAARGKAVAKGPAAVEAKAARKVPTAESRATRRTERAAASANPENPKSKKSKKRLSASEDEAAALLKAAAEPEEPSAPPASSAGPEPASTSAPTLPPAARSEPVSKGAYEPLSVTLGEGSTLVRTIWVRPHDPATDAPDLPSARTLFLSGVPGGASRSSLVEALASFGPVVSLALHGSGASAAVVYEDEDGASALISSAEAGAARGAALRLRTQAEEARRGGDVGDAAAGAPGAARTPTFGLKGWVEQHKALTPGNAELAAELDEWTADFEDRLVAARAAHERSLEEEGWTVVKKRKMGQRGGSGGVGEAAAAAAAAKAADKARRIAETQAAFYRLQARDQRRTELLELRRKFDEDRKRVQDLRSQRKFA